MDDASLLHAHNIASNWLHEEVVGLSVGLPYREFPTALQLS